MTNNRQTSDFDPNALTQQTDEHTRSIAELRETVNKHEKRVGDNEKFADTFIRSFENSKRLDKVVANAIVTLIGTNQEVREALSKTVREVDREWQKVMLRRLGLVAWTLLIALASGGIAIWLKGG